jgi:hypothetical protein
MFMVAALLLAGCSKSDLTSVVEPAGAPVLFKSRSALPAVSVSDATRAPYAGAISEENALIARVLTGTDAADYSTPYADGRMTFVGGVSGYDVTYVTPAGHESFPSTAGDDLYYMAGLYPYDNWDPAPTATTIGFTFTGKEDVMATAPKETTLNKVVAGTYPALTFNHLLTKLEISIVGKDGAAAGKWGVIEKIELIKVAGADPNTRATVTLADGTAAFPTAGSGAFPLYDMSKDGEKAKYTDDVFSGKSIYISETAKPVAYTLIAPFESSAANKLTFSLKTAYIGTAETVEVPLNYTGDTAGRAFGITFIFDSAFDAIVGSAVVIDWIPSGDVTVPVGDNH